MRIIGKPCYHWKSGEPLGIITKKTKNYVWVGKVKYSRDCVVIAPKVKKSKRARKGKAPSQETLDKRSHKDDYDIKIKSDDKSTIPRFMDPTVREGLTLTDKIQIKMRGLKIGSKMYLMIDREFEKVVDAQAYLLHFFGARSYLISEGDRVAMTSDDTRVWSNYSLKKTLTGTQPCDRLVNIINPTELKRNIVMAKKTPTTAPKNTKTSKANKSSAKKTDDKKVTSKKTEAKSADVIVLKVLCNEYKVEPRQARIMLRKEIGNTESGRWEWSPKSKQLKQVRKILQG